MTIATLTARQEYALRRAWDGSEAPGPDLRTVDPLGRGVYLSRILTVERCGCLNHGHGIWHASAAVIRDEGATTTRLDREDDALAGARTLLTGAGEPDWELVLWSPDPDRRTAHIRVPCTPAEGLLIPASCPIAPNDHEEEGTWVPRA